MVRERHVCFIERKTGQRGANSSPLLDSRQTLPRDYFPLAHDPGTIPRGAANPFNSECLSESNTPHCGGGVGSAPGAPWQKPSRSKFLFIRPAACPSALVFIALPSITRAGKGDTTTTQTS